LAICGLLVWPAALHAHSGPAFPIVTTRVVGPYELSVWADPDATRDQTAGGQFWVNVKTAAGSAVPADTRARVSVSPAEGSGSILSGTTRPEKGDLSRQFVALVLDREGRFRVDVEVNGSLGLAKVDAVVDATAEGGGPGPLAFIYAAPFILVALLAIRFRLRQRRKLTDKNGASPGGGRRS